MGLFDKFRKKKPESNIETVFEMQTMLHQMLSKGVGVDADELPNGRGEFGFDTSNPIPCKTVMGSMAYLARLYTLSGVKVESERIGSFGSDVIDSPIDGYRLTDSAGADLGTIYISPYQGRISGKAPNGFKLI